MKCAGRWVWLLVCLGMFAVACGEGGSGDVILVVEDGEGPVSVSRVVVEPEALALAVHESRVLRAEAQNKAGGVVRVGFEWTSEDEGIAVVDGDGQVTGVGAGQTKIVVEAGGQNASVEVTVRALEYRSVAVGTVHSCAVTWGGDVYCWGSNERAQLGLEETALYSVPQKVELPEAMASVSVAKNHSCAVAQGGQAYCWGFNEAYQVGLSGTQGYMVPPLPLRGPLFESVAAADYHTCGLTVDGEVYCWGYSELGALGLQGVTASQTPQKVALEARAKQVVVGENNTCVLDVEGRAYCSGENYYQVLLPYAGAKSLVPVRAGGDVLFSSLAVGSYTVCGVTTQGSTLCWGEEINYSRGRAEVDTYLARPIESAENFVSLSGGTASFCGLTEEGQLHCWGANRYGGLGDGTTEDRLPGPVTGSQRWQHVAVGGMHSCGIDVDGALWCWGNNPAGQLGDGRQLVHAEASLTNAPGLRLETLHSENATTCGKERLTGRVFCWGENTYYQLGQLTPKGHATHPMLMQYSDQTWDKISVGYRHMCGLSMLGQAFCWGSNWNWQLGNGYTGIGNWGLAPVAGNLSFGVIYAGESHTCGLTKFGYAYCWGLNFDGQLGSPVANGSSTPVAVSTDFQFMELALGLNHTCGLTDDGEVVCWGSNAGGVLGSSAAPDKTSSPVLVPLDAPVVSLKSGALHTCGLSADGRLHCWGYSKLGSLGDGSVLQSNGPVEVSGRWSDFEVGGWTTCARNLEKEFYCWGWNAFAQVSADGPEAVASPTLVDPGFAVSDVYSVGGAFVCALNEVGHPSCWGFNSVGQLGIPSSYYRFWPTRVVAGEME